MLRWMVIGAGGDVGVMGRRVDRFRGENEAGEAHTILLNRE